MKSLADIAVLLRDHESDARPSHEHEILSRRILELLKVEFDGVFLNVMAYFLRYGFIPVSGKSFAEAAKNIGSAPWIGSEGSSLESFLATLAGKGILEFVQFKKWGNQWILRLSPAPNSGIEELDSVCAVAWKNIEGQIERRKDSIKDLGWAFQKDIRDNVKNAMANAPTDATIKLMAYHGRTWLSTTMGIAGLIPDLICQRDDLHFQILIASKDAKGKVIEGATKDEHTRSVAFGIAVLRKLDLPNRLKEKLDVRTYGKSDSEALLRCLIVETKEHAIKDCYITAWFFGHERGFHGRELYIDGRSSLAMLCRDYFDATFDKQWPQLSALKQIRWLMVNYWFAILTLVIIPLICLGVFLSKASYASTALEIAIGSIFAGLAGYIKK